ncbi:GT2 family glycosyltransferase [Allocatelliglobosispora scoriae]|uniref:GT2 family glycosyltransferase n=1 Tax=Allocatelliglobosispora scoriae TaxID=643052 RepID=A0A841BZD7_9ACTN|nr:glycosyltransferase family 2 protein [Allocatelliglobosispora scoriae]MBB5872080.1 GT2 family glycosyltransferase [Allocatelliglobosispora scoriae]
MNPMVSVIVVSYNSADLIGASLSGLKNSSISHELIVVDNASQDGSADRVEADFPSADVVRLPENVGFARAINAGAQRAAGDWILMLNPDAEPVGDLLEAFVSHALDRGGRILAGRTLHADGTDDGRSVFAMPTIWGLVCFATGLSTAFRRSRLFNPDELPGLDRTRATTVPAASGCVLLVERALFTKLGGFTPTYFMYGEDIDLCMRAADLGERVSLVPEAKVVHVGGASSTSAGKLALLMRGKATVFHLRWPGARGAVARGLLSFGVGVRALGSAVTGHAVMWRVVWRDRKTWLAGW